MLDESTFEQAVAKSRSDATAPSVFEKTVILSKDSGTLCEAVLIHYGKQSLTPSVGSPLESGADVILSVWDVLSTCYPMFTADELSKLLNEIIKTKIQGE